MPRDPVPAGVSESPGRRLSIRRQRKAVQPILEDLRRVGVRAWLWQSAGRTDGGTNDYLSERTRASSSCRPAEPEGGRRVSGVRVPSDSTLTGVENGSRFDIAAADRPGI